MSRKLEMALLFGGVGGWWDTVIVEVDAPELAVYSELDEKGREEVYRLEEAGEIEGDLSGCYLFSYGSWLDD